ncbi:MAG TPA: HTTM domain-containing protein [Thermodesulfobacteriota bacterium]|nr:HTTM domain-containing protein [Thermodesulfobacteriota bacterium]
MSNKHSSDDRLTIFSFLLAAAVIFHLGKWNVWLQSPVSLALGAAAVSVLLKPSSTRRLYALLVIIVIDVFEKMPWIPNHWLFAMIVSLTVLSSAFIVLIQSRRISAGARPLYDTFAPALRLELLLLYFFAFFHKLNYDWFDPEVSCGALLFSSSFHLPVFPGHRFLSEILPIYGTLILEASIPLFLIFKRLRIAGIILALVFHFILGTFEYYNFSAFTYAFLFLFVPDNFPDRLREWWNGSAVHRHYARLASADSTRRSRAPGLIIAGAACLLLFIYARMYYPALEPHIGIRDPMKLGKPRLYYAFLGLWWIYGLSLIYIFLLVLRRGEPSKYKEAGFFFPANAVLMIFPLLVIINGASPYLGFKTQTTWSMFSNLRTEGGYSNHILVRHPYYIAGYQTDLVEIRRSTDPVLGVFQQSGYLIPYFELRRYISRKRPSYPNGEPLIYIRKGKEFTVSSPDAYPELFKPINYFLRKLLTFRPVPSGARGPCQH